jgi:hypothetical protein
MVGSVHGWGSSVRTSCSVSPPHRSAHNGADHRAVHAGNWRTKSSPQLLQLLHLSLFAVQRMHRHQAGDRYEQADHEIAYGSHTGMALHSRLTASLRLQLRTNDLVLTCCTSRITR